MLAYVAIVHQWSDPTAADTHAAAFADAARYGAEHHREAVLLTLQQGPYRETMASDSAAFYEQLPFYRVRPLYILVVAGCSKFTSTVSAATVLVSVVSVSVCGMLLLWYGVRTAGALFGGGVAALHAISPAVVNAAKLSSPDALLTLWVTLAAILLVRRATWQAAGLLAAGVLIRTDLVVFNLCLAVAWLWLADGRGVAAMTSLLAGSVGLVAAVNAWAGNYGYKALYHFTFIEGAVPHPAALRGLGIPTALFFRAIVTGARYSLANGGLSMVLVLLVLCAAFLRWRRPTGCPDRDRRPACVALLLAVAAYTGIRFILFPELDLRLAAPSVAMLAVVLLTLGGRQPPVRSAAPRRAAVAGVG